jgi:hypothetical protein
VLGVHAARELVLRLRRHRRPHSPHPRGSRITLLRPDARAHSADQPVREASHGRRAGC